MQAVFVRWAMLIVIGLALGCEPPAAVSELPDDDPVATSPAPRESAQPTRRETAKTEPRSAATSQQTRKQPESTKPDAAVSTQPSPQSDPEPGPTTTRQRAEPSVGKKGRGYGGGLVSEPAKQYFGLRERLVFQIQIPQAMQTYNALHGKAPKDHDEFMKSVIRENQIKLPELPDGAQYRYDPETAELLVERQRP